MKGHSRGQREELEGNREENGVGESPENMGISLQEKTGVKNKECKVVSEDGSM